MPLRVTMATLRLQCLQQVDLVTDLSIGVAEANSYISRQYGDLFSVISAAGMRYFEYQATFVTAGLSYLTEPADHLSTVDTIERVLDAAGRTRRLRQIQPQERSLWAGKTGHARKWELVDDRLCLYPTPPVGDTYTLRYIPQPPILTSYGDSDAVDVVTPDGLDFMIWGTGVKLLGKSKSDVTLCMAEREAARGRLAEWASLRAFNDPPRTIVDDDEDDYLRDGDWGYDR